MGTKQVKTVKVSEESLEDWEEYIEENPEVESVSHLIRLSVQKEISGEYDLDKRRASAQSDSDGEAMDKVLTRLRKIQTGQQDIEDRLTALEQADSQEDTYDVQRAAFNALPTPPETTKPVEETDYSEWAATIPQVANQIGAEPETVKQALEKVEATGQVRSVVGGPENKAYYWKVSQ